MTGNPFDSDLARRQGSYAIDRIKEIVPIWKKEHGQDGETWVGGPTALKSSLAPEPD